MIEALLPDVLVKGADWALDEIVGARRGGGRGRPRGARRRWCRAAPRPACCERIRRPVVSAAWVRASRRQRRAGRGAVTRCVVTATPRLSGPLRAARACCCPLLLDRAAAARRGGRASATSRAPASDLRTLLAEAGEAGWPCPSPRPARRPSAACRATPRPRCVGPRRCTPRARGRLRAVVASPAGLLRPVLTPRAVRDPRLHAARPARR